MHTKLIVSLDGLQISNLNQIVSSRSIEDVVVVSTSAGFNQITTAQQSAVKTLKTTLSGVSSNSKLSFAVNSGSEATFTNSSAYNFLVSENIPFLLDPGLTGFTSALVVEKSSISGGQIVYENLDEFSTTLSDNKLWSGTQSNGEFELGTGFGSQSTLNLSGLGTSGISRLSDISGTVAVEISATQFANLIEANNASPGVITLDLLSNVKVPETLTTTSIKPNIGDLYTYGRDSFKNNFDGTNRYGNLLVNENGQTDTYKNRTSPGTEKYNNIWGDLRGQTLTLDVLKALTIPLMGISPLKNAALVGDNSTNILLRDTSSNISAFIAAASAGQLASFNKIVVTDSNPIYVDALSFAKLDRSAVQNAPLYAPSTGAIIEVITSSSAQPQGPKFEVNGTLSEFISSGLYSSSAGFASTLSNDGNNNVLGIQKVELNTVVDSFADLATVSDFINRANATSGLSLGTNVFFGQNFSTSLTTAEFIKLANFDALVS